MSEQTPSTFIRLIMIHTTHTRLLMLLLFPCVVNISLAKKNRHRVLPQQQKPRRFPNWLSFKLYTNYLFSVLHNQTENESSMAVVTLNRLPPPPLLTVDPTTVIIIVNLANHSVHGRAPYLIQYKR